MNIVEHKCWMFGSGNSKYFIKYNKLCMSKCEERESVKRERERAKREERTSAKRGQVRREGKCEERASAKRG